MTDAGPPPADETDAVRERYARRAADDPRYHPLQPDVWQSRLERERVFLRWLAALGWRDLDARRATDVGCGSGGQLLDLLQLGFAPRHLTGLELLPERHGAARERLPAAVTLWLGDACDAPIAPASQDLVLQSTVFSSLLDDAFQQRLADAMWRWVKPGGGVWWYDFTRDNPRNPDVRGVPVARLRALFPQGTIRIWRVTLAPPLARAVCRGHPALYPAFNALPLLRTHALAWIGKPR
jgi:SAM-dependent methyltransferase